MHKFKSAVTKIAKFAAIHLFFRHYYSLRTCWPVWFYILNSEGRKIYKSHPPELNAVTRRVVGDLRQNGIAFTSLDELFPGENILEKVKSYVEKLEGEAKIRANKSFLMRLEGIAEGDILDLQSPLVRLLFGKPIVSIVNSYLEMVAKFFFYSFEITLPVTQGSERVKSQKWHRDPEDKKICKMFIYFNDVDESAGPFTYIPQSHHGGKWRNIFPPHPPRGYYPQEGEIERKIPAENVRVCTGKAGTVIFCDTSGLHRGGYATKNRRIMLTAGWASKALFIPIPYRYPEHFHEQIKAFGPEIAYAVDKNFGMFINVVNAISRFALKRGLYISD